jgi:geranylgeranyl transferase type-2 subunit beta
MLSYLEELTLRLARGVATLPAEFRERQVAYCQAAQQHDGGFAGRQGGSDLYYTGFALRSLAVLGVLDGDMAERSADFLRGRLHAAESIIDFVSLIYGATLLESAAGIDILGNQADAWRDAVAERFETLRRSDGGYAKGPRGRASSTYHTFLVMISLQLLKRGVREPERVAEFLRSQRSGDGGFREIRVSKRGSTNPTAAAIATLQMLDALDGGIRDEAITFLAGMQNEEGGLRANTRIPVADLLSTFTGWLTLMNLEAPGAIATDRARRYVESLQESPGGFRGASWDAGRDVEYTFYGLGCMALLPPCQT